MKTPVHSISILGSHPFNGQSMNKYTKLLAAAYEELGYNFEVLRPSSFLSRKVKNGLLRKLVIYFEKLVIFPIRLIINPPSYSVLHLADHSDGIWLLWPNLNRMTSIVTCHDLIAVRAAMGDFPEHFPKRTGRIYQMLIRSGLAKSTLIAAVSNVTGHDVKKVFPKVRTTTLPNPVVMKPLCGKDNAKLDRPYCLVVSSVGWRKRRKLAINVWVRLLGSVPEFFDLIVVGPSPDNEEKALINEYGFLGSRVTFVNAVSDAELSRLYSDSLFLIQASQYEGFAWPIVEANSFGTPALCAEEPILRETGNGNVFFDPANMDSMDWPKIFTDLIELRSSSSIYRNAGRFGWEKFKSSLTELIE